MLHSRERRADDRTSVERGGRGEGTGMVVVTMRSRIRYGIAGGFGRLSRNEHKILRLFRRTPRYLASYTSNWAFQISSRFFPPSRFSRLHFDCTSWPASWPSYFSHYFSESPPPSPLPFPPPLPPSLPLLLLLLFLLFFLVLARSFQTLLHSREIAFKLFGFLTRRGFIVRNSCCIAQRVPVDLREVGR